MGDDKRGRWAARRAQIMDALRRRGQGARDRPSSGGRAYSAADHDLGGDVDPETPPEYVPGIGQLPRVNPGRRTLRRSDGSTYTTTDRNVGPN